MNFPNTNVSRLTLFAFHKSRTLKFVMTAFFALSFPLLTAPQIFAKSQSAQLIERAEFLHFNGNTLGAIDALEKAREVDSNNADIHLSLLNLYLIEKMQPEAKKECSDLIRLKPNDSIAYMLLANLEKEADVKKSISVLQSAPPTLQNLAKFQSLYGFCYLETSEFEKAITAFNAAIKDDARDNEAKIGLSIAYWRSGDLLNALKTIDIAVAAAPKVAEIRKVKGDMLAESGKFEEAKKELEAALKIDSKLKGVHTSLGHIHIKQNREKEAEELLRKATELNVEDATAFFLLGQLYEKQEKHGEAAREYRNSAYLEKDKVTAAKLNEHANGLIAKSRGIGNINFDNMASFEISKTPVEIFGMSYKDLIKIPKASTQNATTKPVELAAPPPAKLDVTKH